MTPELLALTARQLLDDPVMKQVFEHLAQSYVRAILASTPDDLQTREIAYQRAQALQEIRADLENMASNIAVTAYNRRLRTV